ncbi:MAG: glycosyltransferase family 1 protein [Clostridiales bacterium]|nr:glycosyltransferase family 1 protein [Clostridiales bacterium]
MKNVILTTNLTGGDVLPFIRFGRLLSEEGYKVSIVTHCIYEKTALQNGLDFYAADDLEEYEAMSRDLCLLSDPINHKDDYVRFNEKYHGKEQLLREINILDSLCDDESVIITRYRTGISGMLVAEKRSLPYAPLILAPNYFSHMELHNQIMGKEMAEEINKVRQSLDLEPITDWKDWLYSPRLFLCGWPEWFAQPDETWPDNTLSIGFLERKEDDVFGPEYDEVFGFIDSAHQEGKKVVIITGGSSRIYSKELYTTSIQACLLANVNAIVVTPFKDYVPDDLPDSMMWAKNIRLAKIMNRADLIIHHGGMGTINESVDAAIPQIIMPHLIDGPDNADRLARLGLAQKFSPKQWDPILIANAISNTYSDQIHETCLKYQKINAEVYGRKIWRDAISKIPPYSLPKQKSSVSDSPASNDALKPKLTKQQLMEIIRKRKEKGGQ